MSKLRLEGKVAMITGGVSGIGKEAASLFAENGAYVVLVDVQDDLSRHVAASINESENGRNRVTYHHCDVRVEEQVERAVEFVVMTYGRIDVLFSNAGVIGPMTGILDLDLSGLDETFATNVRGVACTIKYAARAMIAAGTRGSIICTSSVAATLGGAGPPAYSVTKAALLGLVKSACSELGAHGIRVNCVSPYGVATPMSCRAYGLTEEQVETNSAAAANLKGVMLKARHVAEAVLFLASSDESGYVSGHNLALDGGFTVVNRSYSPF